MECGNVTHGREYQCKRLNKKLRIKWRIEEHKIRSMKCRECGKRKKKKKPFRGKRKGRTYQKIKKN